MERAILTREIIRSDLQSRLEHERARYKSDWHRRLFGFGRETRSFITFAVIGVVCCIAKQFALALLWFSLTAVTLAIFLLPMLIEGKRLNDRIALRRQLIERESFRVESDTLERARPDGGGLTLNEESPYLLHFSRYGRYFVPNGTNYAWSKDFP